ncbi:MAG TPA: hypothetical protein DCM28_17545 [Phycisphaerales bacterium]|nr:hypothetical protein [Phycisphaerales bacterium]|tara:strand:- start:264 stop:1364 length:1101 start_codon:yes stop_codon:yes gene_type:complete
MLNRTPDPADIAYIYCQSTAGDTSIMVEIDLSKLASEVSNILMLRGTSLPPLCLADHAHTHAGSVIDDMPDDKLFGVAQISDADMAMAIRSMLLIRCGLISEGSMFAMMAPKIESDFICGIAERNLGHNDAAKNHFHKVQEHPVYQTLHKEAMELLKSSMDKRLTRLHGILELHGDWEPYAFIDVYTEAREGQMSSASEEMVRKIQAIEFNALFLHCYQQLMGIDARKVEVKRSAEPQRRRPVPTRQPKPAAAAPTASATPASNKPATPTPAKAPSNEVRVGCPKCKAIQSFDASKRGQKVQCNKCSVTFAVPGGNGAAASNAQTSVRVACPKCRTAAAYPQSKRGQKVNCSKCNASYTIPSRAAA